MHAGIEDAGNIELFEPHHDGNVSPPPAILDRAYSCFTAFLSSWFVEGSVSLDIELDSANRVRVCSVLVKSSPWAS
jgi:hypothetical protein